MVEYIERTEELILAVNAGARVIENTKKYHGATYCMDVFSDNPKEIPYLKAAEVLREFDGIPAADVALVVHGRWVQSGQCNHKPCRIRNTDKWTTYKCSVCGYSNGRRFSSNYCPNCGARMDGE